MTETGMTLMISDMIEVAGLDNVALLNLIDMRNVEEPQGGRLYLHRHEWGRCGGEIVPRFGATVRWKSHQHKASLLVGARPKEIPHRGVKKSELQRQIQDLLVQRAIEPALEEEVLWENPTFIIPKKNGKYRLIVDCRKLNEALQDSHYKNEGMEDVVSLVRRNDFATTLDLSAAFHHVPVNRSLAPFLGMRVLGRLFRCRGLPFGMKLSPQIFQEVLAHPIRYIRERWGVRLIVYMDDILLLHHDPDLLERATLLVAAFLQKLGWTISLEKCHLQPSQVVEYLGWKWNLHLLQSSMISSRRKQMLSRIISFRRRCVANDLMSTRELARMIGLLVFLRFQFPSALLYLNKMHRLLAASVRLEGWDGNVRLHRGLLGEIGWWEMTLRTNKPRSLAPVSPQATLTTDASRRHWGATLEIQDQTLFLHGNFSSSSLTSSNQRESMAVLLAIRRAAEALLTKQVKALKILCDNSVTVANLRRRRASAPLLQITRQIFLCADSMNMDIVPVHLPGVRNGVADALSRLELSGDYQLMPSVLSSALSLLGIKCTIDMFAAPWNAQFPRWIGWTQASFPLSPNAMTSSWEGEIPYLFPPIALLSRVLQKLRAERIREAVLVIPQWPGQPWWPVLQEVWVMVVDVGPASQCLRKGPLMSKKKRLLPPGRILIAKLCCDGLDANHMPRQQPFFMTLPELKAGVEAP
jgi:hypothetical protein